jgi:hypothetical protein
MDIQKLAKELDETISEVEAALQVGQGEICYRRLWGEPDCGCPTCMTKFPGPIRIE